MSFGPLRNGGFRLHSNRYAYALRNKSIGARDVTNPTFTSANPSDAYDQGSTVAGTLTASEAVTWSKSGADAGTLTLNASTGEWSLDTSAIGPLSVTVTATDGAGHRTDQVWAISIVAVPGGLPTPILTWTSGTATYDPVFGLTEVTESDVVEIHVDDDPAFGSLYGSDTNTIDAAEALSGSLTFPGIPTLAVATTYYARARYTRGGSTSGWSTSVSKAMAGDTTAPTLSSPTDTANGSNGAIISVSTNEGNGALSFVLTTSSTPPTATQVEAGQDHAGSPAAAFGSQSVTSTGVKTFTPIGLSPGTAYYTYFVHRDAAGNPSTVSAADGFATLSAGPPDTADLLAWLDADDISTLWTLRTKATPVVADGDSVGAWADKSAAGGDYLAPANDSTRPIYHDVGGVKCVQGDGINDLLSGPAFNFLGAPRTIQLILNGSGLDNLYFFACGNTGNNNPVFGLQGSGADDVKAFIRNTTPTTVSISPLNDPLKAPLDATWHVLTITHDGAGNFFAYVDNGAGVARAASLTGAYTADNVSLFGWKRLTSNQYGAVKIAGFRCWNKVLDSTKRAAAVTQAGSKVGLSI